MIRPLRQRHRHMFTALGIFLPIAFGLGIVARKPFPSMDPLSGKLSAASPKVLAIKWERNDLFGKLPIRVRLSGEEHDPNYLAVGFSTPSDNFIKPDLMVYWIPGNQPIDDKLPDSASLLGGFDSGDLTLPAEAATNRGVLALYSLADNELVEVSRSIQFNRTPE